MKVLKLIPKILVSPLLLAVGIVYVIGNFLAAISSVVTNLVGGFILFGSVFGWIVHANQDMLWSVTACGIVILLLPTLAKGLLEIVLHLSGPLFKLMAW